MLRRSLKLLSLFRKPKPPIRPARPQPDGALTESHWARQRQPEREQDRVLSSVARRWLAALPARAQPHELCARFPRVANRMALCWNDAMLCERLFDDLMINRRGGRRGFPPEVVNELLRLRDFSTYNRKIDEKLDLWRAQATADR